MSISLKGVCRVGMSFTSYSGQLSEWAVTGALKKRVITWRLNMVEGVFGCASSHRQTGARPQLTCKSLSKLEGLSEDNVNRSISVISKFRHSIHAYTPQIARFVSRVGLGESHARQVGLVLIVCVLNLALQPPTDSFTKMGSCPEPYSFSTNSLFTVSERRRGQGKNCFIWIL